MKMGDKIKVLDSFGKEIDAVYVRLSYRKNPKAHEVKIKRKIGSNEKTLSWFLPESRIMGL